MILDDYVLVKLNSRNKNHLSNKGYDISQKDEIKIAVSDLSKGSKAIINVSCDICNKTKKIEYRQYLNSYKNQNIYACSSKCAKEKREKTNLKNWGVDNVYKSTIIIDKIKDINKNKSIIEKREIKEKREKTNLNKWGHKYPIQNKFVKAKAFNTILEKYKVKYPMQSDIIKKTRLQNNQIKYNVDYPSQLDNIKQKTKTNNINKWGYDIPSKSPNVKHKTLKNNRLRYNVDYPNQLQTVKDNIKNTNLRKYGVTSTLKLKKCKNNSLNASNTKTINKLNKVLKDGYNLIKYENSLASIRHINCSSIFDITNSNILNRMHYNVELCTICNPINNHISSKEKDLKIFINELNIKFNENDRTILDGKELDVYVPTHNLAIEFNGLYWHSELYKDKNYHLDKTIKCQEKGIQLLHIFEDDWILKHDIIKSIIKNKLGKINNIIYARQTSIKEVPSNIAREFLDKNHIQGFARSKYKIGLYHRDELVSLMTFGYRKTNAKKEFELIRFCNRLNTNVIGASSKLFKHFINNYKIEETYIISYADISLFDGKMYDMLGFKEIHLTKPNYFWIVDSIKEHRWKYNKQKLVKEGHDPSLTEVEIMHNRGYYRLWSCGQKRYEYTIIN